MEPLVVPATLDSLSPVREYVAGAAEAAGLDKKASYNLCLAVDEIVTNIVTYGYKDVGSADRIAVDAQLTEEALTITLEDSAPPFDPRARGKQEEALIPRSLGDRQIGGMGIYLALSVVDVFDYQRVGDRNRNILTMRRPRTG